MKEQQKQKTLVQRVIRGAKSVGKRTAVVAILAGIAYGGLRGCNNASEGLKEAVHKDKPQVAYSIGDINGDGSNDLLIQNGYDDKFIFYGREDGNFYLPDRE